MSDPDQPLANGKPHYKTAAGGHLYYFPGHGNWFLSTEFAPDEAACTAHFATAGAVPVGAAVWQYCDSDEWVERERRRRRRHRRRW